MEWRCEWCGKPHDENDPPCDNCGHGKFEEAVVRQTDLAEQSREATLVWVCTECGREHPKHAPPCSRCGNATLEKQRQEIDEAELSSPGYLDLLTPQYAAVLGVTLLLASVFVLGFAGVVDIPGFGQSGPPTVEDVPGNATHADDIALSGVETAYLQALDEDRQTRGLGSFERTDGMDDIARFYNQRRVKSLLADGTLPDIDRMEQLLADQCQADVRTYVTSVRVSGDDTASDAGRRLAQAVLDGEDWRPDSTARTTGVDVHSADGRLYLVQFVCRG